MKNAVRVTISLPAEILKAAERERRARGETRSAFFRQALEARLRQVREDQAVDQYLRGYQEQPETEEEITVAGELSRTSAPVRRKVRSAHGGPQCVPALRLR